MVEEWRLAGILTANVVGCSRLEEIFYNYGLNQ
jgi:hypothetical protein